MRKEKITIQDIADTLQLSRNTVSKALNGQYVPAHTRERVLKAAIEMGYKSYRTVAAAQKAEHKRIVLIASKLLMTMTYFVYLVRGVESALEEEENVELLQFTATKSSYFDRLVEYLFEHKVDGIICMELFRADYVPRLIALGYPIVFFDLPMYITAAGNFDIVLPESFSAVKSFCLSLIRERGIKKFGFVGDYTHCTSFYERFLAMREAVFLAGLDYVADYSIIEKDSFPYGNPKELAKVLSKMPLPECFICANDTLAIALVEALSLIGKKVPDDILVTGFDNVPESKTCTPPLTTFNVDKSGLGKTLFSVLMDRIRRPRQKGQIICVQSKLIPRGTT